MGPILTALMLVIAGSTFAFTMYRRIAPLFALRRVDRLWNPRARLLGLLRFGFGQRRLLDRAEIVPGLLHVVLFLAFLVLSLQTITLFGLGFSPRFHLPLLAPETSIAATYAIVKDVMVVVALAASLAFLWRRRVTRPERLTFSWEGDLILFFIAALMSTELIFDGAVHLSTSDISLASPAGSLMAELYRAIHLPPSWANALGTTCYWAHLALILVFGNLLPYGKHFHILTALPNVYFRALPAGSACLDALELEEEDARFGTRAVNDLSWKEGLDLYSCTECGRCQTHCPTFLTGKPLSHKEVNRTLRRHLVEQAPRLMELARLRDPEAKATAAAALPALTSVVSPETFWACTTCGWCETACPIFIENVPRLVDLRRQKVLVDADFPDEAARIFRNIETQGNPWGLGANRRTEWCEGLDVPLASSGKPFDVLFFVGCAGAFDERQKKVSRAIVQILREAKVSFAILGDEETCNGEAARRLGNEYLFQSQVAANVERMNAYGITKILVQCPHCFNTLHNEFPRFDGHYEVISHTEFIGSLVREGKLRPGRAVAFDKATVTFHDPCYLGRHNGRYAAPRELLASAGVHVTEMPRSGPQSFCCGAGGGQMWLEEKLGTRIHRARAAEAADTLGAAGGVVATACPFCSTMLGDGMSELGRDGKIRVMDVAEIVAAGLPKPKKRRR